MATFYLDFENGNDGNAGTSFALRWKTFTSGATAARIAPGDTIRIMASPDETLVGDATWTQNSKTVTLAGAVTANITTCESAWTASANVTATAVATGKEGTNYANLAVATAFTTGKCAYFATGTINLSSYQQVSFWILTNASISAGQLSIRLCTDTTGDTSVHTVAIPAIAATNNWIPITVDLATNLNSAIASVALYQDVDRAAITLRLDNIIACKAASSADSLNLTSLIGKVWNRSWVASTAYAANDFRIPTPANRTGFAYKVTAGGGGNSGSSEPTWPVEIGTTVTDGALTWTCDSLEDTWYPIQSINGTTVLIDTGNNTASNAGRGYANTTETVATYKRETIKQTIINSGTAHSVQDSGSIGSEIVFSGGWNRTDMSTQTGQTWSDLQSGKGEMFTFNGKNYVRMLNIGAVRGLDGFRTSAASSIGCVLQNVHANGNGQHGIYLQIDNSSGSIIGACANNNTVDGIEYEEPADTYMTRITTNGNLGSGIHPADYGVHLKGNYIVARNNGVYGIHGELAGVTVNISNYLSSSNVSGGFAPPALGPGSHYFFYNSSLTDSTPFVAPVAQRHTYIYSTKDGQTANNHLITTDGGTIISATDQRHTASGISWKFRPTSTTRDSVYPMTLSVAKVRVLASTTYNFSIWTRRDSTNISGRLIVEGGQIAGLVNDTYVDCTPSINTWTQSSNVTVTPTEDGVIEIKFLCWDGTGTTNNMWIDDFTKA